ncbi:MAG TPA: hypothetical protein VNJ52_10580 [Patescibacteria group bacterium]|nr:hypothetical protein [Patescibacteria group bacterium]
MKKFLVVLFAGLGLMVGCGGGTTAAIVVSASSSASSLQAGGSATITATLTNDSTNQGVKWAVSCGGASCGSVSPTSSTTSPFTTTYTAPATPPSSNLTVTITATSVKDPTKSATVTITVLAITVSVNPATPQTVNAGSSAQFTATVSNDPASGGVNWTLTQGATPCSPTCGSVSPAATASGAATTYTAPTTPPASTLTITLTATSATDNTKSASVTITVPAISVSVSPTTEQVEAKGTAQFTATVGGTSNTAVAWTLTEGVTPCSPTCGTLSSPTSNPTTYTAPATPPLSDLTVTLTAVSNADATKSGSATITVPAITVSVSPTSATVVISTTQNFTATASNDPANAGVTWALSQGGGVCTPTCGTLTSVTTTSVTYNAPASVPTSPTVTLTATSVTDGTKTASATITLATSIAATCGSGSESLLNGQYAFLLKGFDSSGNPALVGGVITVDGSGDVTAGTMDMNLNTGVQAGLAVTSSSSSYTIGSDHRGCMTLTTSAGTQDYRFSLGGITSGVASTGHMIDFDTTGPFTTGVLLQQTKSAFLTTAVTGNFAFGLSSIQNTGETNDNGVPGGKFAAVGVFNLNAGVVSGGEVDYNQNGELDGNTSNTAWPSSPGTISAGGTYTIDLTSGRGTLSFTPGGAGGAVPNVIYVISSNEFLVLSSAAQASNVIYTGTALKQASGSFSSSWLSGTGVYYESALGSGGAGTTGAQVGLISGSGNSGTSGNFTITSYQNFSGSFAFQSNVAGTFTIDSSTGRALTAGTGAGNHPPVLYAVGTNEAFILDNGGSVNSGFMQPQSGTISASSVKGTFAFGSINPEDPSVSDSVGVATFDGTSVITGTSDDNSAGTLDAGSSISQTYSVDSNGLGHSPSGCTVSATSTTCNNIFLFISPTKTLELDLGSTHPSPNSAEQ